MSVHHRHLMRSEPGAQGRWSRLREDILKRDRHCQLCGVFGRSVRYEVHHIRPVSAGGDAWDPANLQLLCRDCHLGIHGMSPRSSDGQTWDEYVEAAAADRKPPDSEAGIAY